MGLDKKLMLDLIPQFTATFFGSLMAVSDGMTYGWTSPMIPYFKSNISHIQMRENDINLLETLNLLGYLAGVPFTLFSVDYFGRKISMVLSAMAGCVAWILLLIATNVNVIFISRFLAGMAGNMCFVATPLYVAEISYYKVRGFLSSLIFVMMILGIATVYCTGILAPYWVTSALGIVITASQAFIVLLLPESPYYYLLQNNNAKAKKALAKLRINKNITQEFDEIAAEVRREKSKRGSFRDIITVNSNRRGLLICLLLSSIQHFVGIGVFLMNLELILDQAGSVYIESTTASIAFAFIMLLSIGLASCIIDKFGRKFLLIISSFLTGLSLLAMSIYYHLQYMGKHVTNISWIPAVCIMVYAATFKVGLGVVPFVIQAEILPTTVKSLGLTLSDLFYFLAQLLSITVYQTLYNHFGLHVPLYVFTACSFSMIFFTIFWIPETKGKTFDEIQIMMRKEPVDETIKKAVI